MSKPAHGFLLKDLGHFTVTSGNDMNDSDIDVETSNGTLFYSSHSPSGITLTCCMTLLSCSTVFGNALVISAVAQFHRLRSTGNFLICSLATADLIVGLFVMPFHVVRRIYGYWPLGVGACDFWHSLDVLASTASIWNLCVISLDRYIAVRDPLTYRSVMSTVRAQFAVSCVWMFSAMLAFPSIIWWHRDSPHVYRKPHECRFTDSFSFLVASSLLSFYVPLLIMVFAYCKVYTAAALYEKSLRLGTKSADRKRGFAGVEMRVHRGRSERAVNESSPTNYGRPLPTDALSVGGVSNCSESDNVVYETLATPRGSLLVRKFSHDSPLTAARMTQRAKATKQWNTLQSKINRFAREKKAAKTLGIVMGCFICCWSPFFVFNVIDGIKRDLLPAGEAIFFVTTWLGYCNSALNPMIYAWHNMEFRLAFKTLLKCKPVLRRARTITRRRCAPPVARRVKRRSAVSNYGTTVTTRYSNRSNCRTISLEESATPSSTPEILKRFSVRPQAMTQRDS